MSRAPQPLVTVVTPSRNYGRYIAQCLESVRCQTHPRIEHLVHDACSNDGTREVVEGFLGSYDLRAVYEEDAGQADAINKGLARARGEIFCWLNADDYWLHERVVEEAVAALEVGGDVVTAGGQLVDEEGRRGRRFPIKPHWILPELRYYDTVLQPATLWRRAVHRELRTDLEYAFDWQLWLDMRRAGARFVVRSGEWAAYRMHGVNKTAADPARRRAEVARILEEQFGRMSPQALWARAVYRGYRAAERAGLPPLKRAVALANIALYHLTFRRVFSC